MGRKQESVWDRLERFRRSPVIGDVLSQRCLQSRSREAIEEILSTPDDEFLDALRTFLSELPMLRQYVVGPILEKNTVREIKRALSKLLDEELEPAEALSDLWSLEGAGPFFSSYMLALATGGEYVIYEKTLLDGMNDVAPDLLTEITSVDGPESYMKFMDICRAVAEVYGFTSLAELHEFLWHGKNTDWTFE